MIDCIILVKTGMVNNTFIKKKGRLNGVRLKDDLEF